jgi:putative transposase
MLRYIWFVFYSSKAVKEYKEELVKSQKQNERLTTLVGKVTVEKEWLAKKLKSLGLSNRKPLVEFDSVPLYLN